MNDEFDFGSAVVGFIFGVILMFAVASSPWSIATEAKIVVAACEKELPRSQKCELSAVPSQEQSCKS
jgi:hypothetical protein